MKSDLIVLISPGSDSNARLCACSKPFHVQTFVSELAVEAFIKTVLPWFTRVAERCIDAMFPEPFKNSVRNKLSTIV